SNAADALRCWKRSRRGARELLLPVGKQRERAPVRSLRQPLVTTGCGYLPIGALPTGYLPIGALPTTGCGGGGSRRGRSAAAAAVTMPRTAAVASRIFVMTNPLLLVRHPKTWPSRGCPLHSRSQGGFHRCTFTMR